MIWILAYWLGTAIWFYGLLLLPYWRKDYLRNCSFFYGNLAVYLYLSYILFWIDLSPDLKLSLSSPLILLYGRSSSLLLIFPPIYLSSHLGPPVLFLSDYLLLVVVSSISPNIFNIFLSFSGLSFDDGDEYLFILLDFSSPSMCEFGLLFFIC